MARIGTDANPALGAALVTRLPGSFARSDLSVHDDVAASAGPPADSAPPWAIDFFPAAGSRTLPPDWSLGITFSEAVKAGDGTITLRTAAGDVVQIFPANDPGLHFCGSSLVIDPAADLQPGTTYRLVVAPGAVEDLAGNAYAGENGYTFTTAGSPAPPQDTVAPVATDFFPAPGSNTLPPDWSLGITFSEAVQAGCGAITLRTAAGEVVQTFAAASDPGIRFIGSSLVVDPAADLQAGTTYQLVVAPDAVEDLAGNAYAGESGYTFTTAGNPAPPQDTVAPVATDFFPAPGSNTLPPDWNIGITFSEAVQAGSGTVTLRTAAGEVVQTFTAASDPGIQFIGPSLVINPTADLRPGTTYTLTVGPDAVEDLAGNAFAGVSGYTFATAAPGPRVLDNVPAYNWYHGCTPTAVASIFGYWDVQGFADYFDANGWDQVRETVNVRDEISSPAHNAKYDPTPDNPALPVPPMTSIADFLHTSQDPLAYGWTWVSDMERGVEGYASLRGQPLDARTVSGNATTWPTFVSAIDAGRPSLFVVDSNGDGSTDHTIPVLGYDDRGAEGLWYGAYTTWSESETVSWFRFQPMGSGISWGVAYSIFIDQSGAASQGGSIITDARSATGGSMEDPAVGLIGSDPQLTIAWDHGSA